MSAIIDLSHSGVSSSWGMMASATVESNFCFIIVARCSIITTSGFSSSFTKDGEEEIRKREREREIERDVDRERERDIDRERE